MVMEFDGLGSTKWTSNSPRPFARSPGAGVSGMPATGFSATPATIQGDDMLVLAKRWQIEVVRSNVSPGQNTVPAMLVQLRFTDRGAIALGAQLDASLLPPLRKAGFKISKTTSFSAVPVTWSKVTIGGDLFAPVVASPASLAGIRYAGNAVTLPWTSAQAVDPAELGKLPSSLYVYTFATTSDKYTMTDADGAKVLSVLHDWLQAQTFQAYMTGKATLMPVDKNVFPGSLTPLAAGVSGLALLIGWEMLASHARTKGV